jgi:hypothetical protein
MVGHRSMVVVLLERMVEVEEVVEEEAGSSK